jgi:hypothetical protein
MTLTTTVHTDVDGIRHTLGRLELPCFVVDTGHGIGVCTEEPGSGVVASVGPLPPERLGSATFRARHRVGHSYLAGAMAGGIASEELVIALARRGFLGSFGAAGLLPDRVARALDRLATEITDRPFAPI